MPRSAVTRASNGNGESIRNGRRMQPSAEFPADGVSLPVPHLLASYPMKRLLVVAAALFLVAVAAMALRPAPRPLAALPEIAPRALDGYLLRLHGRMIGVDRPLAAAANDHQHVAHGRILVELDPARREALLRRLGLEVVGRIASLGFDLVRIPAESDSPSAFAARLAREPGVLVAEPDHLARVAHDDDDAPRPALRSKDPIHYAQTALDHLHARAAWATSTGEHPVTVAIVDTGIDPAHEDLAGAIKGGIDLVNGDDAPEDNLGHGTAMAGLVGAPGDNQVGIAGLCWKVELMPVKVANHKGVAAASDVARGIVHAAEHGARVILVALGVQAESVVLRRACQRAVELGALVVAAAGNECTHWVSAPARYPEVLAVASAGGARGLGLATNLGPEIEVAAPGEDVVVTVPGSLYSVISGTSCAAAHVAGVAALLFSHTPALTAPQVRAILRRSVAPIDALARQPIYDFGALDARLALEESTAVAPDGRIRRVRTLPRRPVADRPFRLVVELENSGNVACPASRVVVRCGGQTVEAPTRELAIGERRELAIELANAPRGPAGLEVVLAPVPGETRVTDNATTLALAPVPAGERDLAIVLARLAKLDHVAGTAEVEVTVENRGATDARGIDVELTREGALDAEPLARATIDLDRGLRQRVRLALAVGALDPAHPAVLVRLRAGEADASPADDEGQLVLPRRATDGEAARLYYQQSGGIDIVPDAPFRVQTDRAYVPVLVYVPDQGGAGPDRYLELTRTQLWSREHPEPEGGGTLLYDDAPGEPPVAAADGLTIVDEMGAPIAGLDLFGTDAKLLERGRHQILRVPLAALGVGPHTAGVTDTYVEVRIRWKQKRKIFFFFDDTREGEHRKVLRIRASSHPLPRLPGRDQHYYDAHHHTIAEWFTGDPWKLFAPRKAFGGPIQMIAESAYAIGLVDDLVSLEDLVITTDHNVFYDDAPSPGVPTTDPELRPPYGPTSPAASMKGGVLATEWARYREIFGLAAGQEVTFSQNQALGLVPLGAHLLSHRSQHFAGSWHGGSTLTKLLGEGDIVELDSVLHALASGSPTENRHAFSYAAHPDSAQGWNDENLELALGVAKGERSRRYVNAAAKQFVFKGLQVMNGDGAAGRALDTKHIDFEQLNPWKHDEWRAGAPGYDVEVWKTQQRWHEAMSRVMLHAFDDDPRTVFVRKLFGEAGSDAHGDFNFATNRAATLLKFRATYAVNSSAWAKVRTLALGDATADTVPGESRGERLMRAMAAGRSLMTDGPLVHFEIDADTRFDGETLAYHDRTESAADADGQVGGAGPYDGGRTALAIAKSPDLAFRYRTATSPEFGSDGGKIRAIHIYKNEAGAPNPHTDAPNPGAGFLSAKTYARPRGVGSLVPGADGEERAEPIDAAEEGLVAKPTAFLLGAYTGADPNTRDLGPDEGRCLTNPIWVVPVVAKVAATPAGRSIARHALDLELVFPITMTPAAYKVGLVALDAAGNADGRSPLLLLSAAVASGVGDATHGWRGEVPASSVWRLTNDAAIDLDSLPRYPDADTVTFVAYFHDRPLDAHGNAMNRIAVRFAVPVPTAIAGTDPPASGSGSGAGSMGAGTTGSAGTPSAGNGSDGSAIAGMGNAATGSGSESTGAATGSGAEATAAGTPATAQGGSASAPGSGETSSPRVPAASDPPLVAVPGTGAGVAPPPRPGTSDGAATRDPATTPGVDPRTTRRDLGGGVPIYRPSGQRPAWKPEPLDESAEAAPGAETGGPPGRTPRADVGPPDPASERPDSLSTPDQPRPLRVPTSSPGGASGDATSTSAPGAPHADPLAAFGCFVATASLAGGDAEDAVVVSNSTGRYRLSPACARELDSLRHLRDRVLVRFAVGGAFVRGYYRVSPAWAREIRDRPWACTAIRVAVVHPTAIAARVCTGDDQRPAHLALAALVLAWVGLRARRTRFVA